MLVFPAIDLMGGAAVRLEQGRRESAKVYGRAPWEVAARFAAAGAPRIHVVDLDAAFTRGTSERKRQPRHDRAHRRGGRRGGRGRRRRAHRWTTARRCSTLGVKLVVLGTAAVKDPALVEAACARWPGGSWSPSTRARARSPSRAGPRRPAPTPSTSALAVARAGAAAVLYTDIGRDGMRSGPNLEATARLAHRLAPCPVIASGGVARLEDLDALAPTGAAAVVVGKALYENAFTVEEARRAPCARRAQLTCCASA